jgi:hypothetical protein
MIAATVAAIAAPNPHITTTIDTCSAISAA